MLHQAGSANGARLQRSSGCSVLCRRKPLHWPRRRRRRLIRQLSLLCCGQRTRILLTGLAACHRGAGLFWQAITPAFGLLQRTKRVGTTTEREAKACVPLLRTIMGSEERCKQAAQPHGVGGLSGQPLLVLHGRRGGVLAALASCLQGPAAPAAPPHGA